MSLQLLLVDDNPDDRALVRREIAKVLPDALVDEAGDLERFESLLQQRQLPWDVVITDYALRWSTGLDVFRRVRARVPDVPVILFTASGSEELAVEALKEGVNDYITKTPKHYGRVPYAVRACAQQRVGRRQADAARRALERQSALLELAMDAGGMDAWEYDPHDRLLLLGRLGKGPLSGVPMPMSMEHFLGLLQSHDREAVQAAWQVALAQSTPLRVAFRITLQGEQRWLQASAMRGGTTMEGRWVGVVHDVTDAKRRQAALEDADRQKNEFIATLAHELRNPLAPLRYVGRLITADAAKEHLARAQEVIDRQVGAMARLLDDLLDVSRLTLNRVSLHMEPLDLRVVVQHALGDAQEVVARAGHELTWLPPQEPVWINGDSVRMQEIVDNLLTNAIKFTTAPGALRVSLRSEEAKAVLSVKDTGIGLDGAMLERIFEPFVQARESSTSPGQGLGIGLAVVRRLTQAHGGTVTASSEGPGKGACFEVRLPLLGAAHLDEQKPSAPLQVCSAGQRRVLVADDERDVADSLSTLLRTEGYEVVAAYDGATARAAAARFLPEVMVLDIGMPNGSGEQVARWTRDQPWGREVKLIAVTGWGREEDRRRTARAGFDVHLVKPVSAERLLAEVARA